MNLWGTNNVNKNFSTWPCFSVQEAEKVKKILLSNKVNYWTERK